MSALPELVSVVVVAYGDSALLAECVDSLLASTGVRVEVVVVDNGVTGDALSRLPDRPEVRVWSPGSNLGFAGGCNYGAAQAGGTILAFVNPDTRTDPEALRELARALDDPGVGIVSGQIRLLDEPELLNSRGSALHFLGLAWAMGYREPADRYDTPSDVAAASGAGMAVRTSTFRSLGGFTEELFLYHEDAELSLRCRLRGLAVRYLPSARIYHDYQFDRHPTKTYYIERNRLVMVLTCYQTGTLFKLAPALLAFELGILAVAIAQGWGRQKVRGWWWLTRHVCWLRGHRRRVQSTRAATDRHLAALTTGHFDASQMPLGTLGSAMDRVLAAYWDRVRPRSSA